MYFGSPHLAMFPTQVALILPLPSLSLSCLKIHSNAQIQSFADCNVMHLLQRSFSYISALPKYIFLVVLLDIQLFFNILLQWLDPKHSIHPSLFSGSPLYLCSPYTTQSTELSSKCVGLSTSTRGTSRHIWVSLMGLTPKDVSCELSKAAQKTTLTNCVILNYYFFKIHMKQLNAKQTNKKTPTEKTGANSS